jgi:LacI family transcriptional regulator
MSGPRQRVKLADVALRAGVSRATASRALSGDRRISEPTRDAVRAAASDLGYVPNVAARGLRARTTRALGLLLSDLSDPVHGQVAAGFELVAAAAGYTVIIVAAHDVIEQERRALTAFVERSVDGVCIASSALDPDEARERVAPSPLVVVQPDHECILDHADALPPGTIRTDDRSGVEQAVRHLLASGHRELAYVGAGTRATNALRRTAAERVLREVADRPLRVRSVPEDSWSDPMALSEALGPRMPDAVLCYDDKLALALLDGLRSRRLGVPADVAVVGFDDIPFAALANPRLTTVSTPTLEMGRLAAATLLATLGGRTLPPPVVLPVELVVRESAPAQTVGSTGSRGHRLVTAGRG